MLCWLLAATWRRMAHRFGHHACTYTQRATMPSSSSCQASAEPSPAAAPHNLSLAILRNIACMHRALPQACSKMNAKPEASIAQVRYAGEVG